MKKLTHLKYRVEGLRRGQIRTLAGAFLAIMGFFWLSKKAGCIPTEMLNASLFWPIATLAVGVMLLVSQHERHSSHRDTKGTKKRQRKRKHRILNKEC